MKQELSEYQRGFVAGLLEALAILQRTASQQAAKQEVVRQLELRSP